MKRLGTGMTKFGSQIGASRPWRGESRLRSRWAHGLKKRRKGIEMSFLLKDLTCDMILGEDFLEDTNAFETYRHAFALQANEGLPQLNTIT